MTRKWLRWLPAAAVPALIAAGVLAGPLPASAGDPLPDKSPEQVLALIAQHRGQALSGVLEQSSNLGLPELPAAGAGTAGAGWLELLTGPHTARVYLDGPDKARIQVMDRLAERNAVRHGSRLWFYNSRDNTAAHAQLPAGTADRHAAGKGLMATPEELAARLLAALDDSTDLTARPGNPVAGRATYELLLVPGSADGTLVASIMISVDGQTGLPLGVEVGARGQSGPAFRLAFTSLELEAPDPALFEFTPPPGATVQEIPVPADKPRAAVPLPGLEIKDIRRGNVTGTGWESVVEFPARADTADAGKAVSGAARLLEQATVPVPGGRLLSTSLVNVLILDDGRVLAGSVPAERLQAVAAQR